MPLQKQKVRNILITALILVGLVLVALKVFRYVQSQSILKQQLAQSDRGNTDNSQNFTLDQIVRHYSESEVVVIKIPKQNLLTDQSTMSEPTIQKMGTLEIAARNKLSNTLNRIWITYQIFDSAGNLLDSRQDDLPYDFIIGKNLVIPAWEVSLKDAAPDETYWILSPPQFAFGERGLTDIVPPNTAVIFKIDILRSEKL